MVRRLGGVVVVGSLLRWRVGGSLPAFSLFWGGSKRVVPEQLAKCYGLGAGGRLVEPLPPHRTRCKQRWGVFSPSWGLCIGSSLSFVYGA